MKWKMMVAVAGAALLAGYGAATIQAGGTATPPPATAGAAAPAKAPEAVKPEPEPAPVAPESGPLEVITDDRHMGALAPPPAPSVEDFPVGLLFERKMGTLGQPLTYMIVQAESNAVAVQSIEVNRGNCGAVPSPATNELPKTLKFGQTMRFLAFGCDMILEVSVTTDTGEYVFNGPV